MYPLYFSALLKSSSGRLLEYGEACLSETPGTMDFNSEFVPLLRLGEAVEIVRAQGETELDRFPGRVYRCTRKSLRLTDIPEEALRAARELFAVNAHIPVSLALSPDGTAEFPEEKASRVNGNIRLLSPDCLKVTALEFIPEGQVFTLSTEAGGIRLNRLAVRVARRVPLGRSAALLLCDVRSPSPENARALSRYAASQGPQVRLL